MPSAAPRPAPAPTPPVDRPLHCRVRHQPKTVSNHAWPSRIRSRDRHSGTSADARVNAWPIHGFPDNSPDAARRLSISTSAWSRCCRSQCAAARRGGDHRQVIVAVTATYRVGFPGLAELLLRILADCLQQPVARSPPPFLGHHQRLVHQQVSWSRMWKRSDFRPRIRNCAASSRIHPRTPRALEQRFVPAGQQGMRPINGGVQRLLAANRHARAARQQPESIVEAPDDLGQRQRPHSRRRQFDGQRETVEAAAQVAHHADIVFGDHEFRTGTSRPVGEQADGVFVEGQ